MTNEDRVRSIFNAGRSGDPAESTGERFSQALRVRGLGYDSHRDVSLAGWSLVYGTALGVAHLDVSDSADVAGAERRAGAIADVVFEEWHGSIEADNPHRDALRSIVRMHGELRAVGEQLPQELSEAIEHAAELLQHPAVDDDAYGGAMGDE
jgi:hypothetical protein